jgi:hypothetical protein
VADQSHHIEVYTNALVINGWYDMAIYRRVSDALNGEQRRYLPLRDATVMPLGQPNATQRVGQMLVARDAMIVVATLAEAPPPPGYDRDDLVHSRQPRQAMFFTDAFVVRGVAHLRTDLELHEQLERDDDSFLRLSRVQIFPIQNGGSFNRDFVALRRERITALYPLAMAPSLTPVPALPAEGPLPPALPDDAPHLESAPPDVAE